MDSHCTESLEDLQESLCFIPLCCSLASVCPGCSTVRCSLSSITGSDVGLQAGEGRFIEGTMMIASNYA